MTVGATLSTTAVGAISAALGRRDRLTVGLGGKPV